MTRPSRDSDPPCKPDRGPDALVLLPRDDLRWRVVLPILLAAIGLVTLLVTLFLATQPPPDRPFAWIRGVVPTIALFVAAGIVFRRRSTARRPVLVADAIGVQYRAGGGEYHVPWEHVGWLGWKGWFLLLGSGQAPLPGADAKGQVAIDMSKVRWATASGPNVRDVEMALHRLSGGRVRAY